MKKRKRRKGKEEEILSPPKIKIEKHRKTEKKN